MAVYGESTERLNALVDTGATMDCEYVGERNAAGQREVRGTYTFASSAVYEGGWYNRQTGHRQWPGMLM